MSFLLPAVYTFETDTKETPMSQSIPFEVHAPIASTAPAARSVWVGRAMSGFIVLFLAFDAAIKLLRVPAAVDGTRQLGYPESVVLPLGILQVVLLIAYLVPRTAILGAVLWTGYLGGAIATHVRIGNPLFSHVLFPIYVAAFLWVGLWLRDRRLRAVLAPR